MELKDKEKIGSEEKKEPGKSVKFNWNSIRESSFFYFLKRNVKKIVILLVIIYAVVTAFQVNAAVQESKLLSEDQDTQNFEEVVSQDISNSISVTGTIAATEKRTLSTLVSKTEVTDVFVEVGDYVNVGDPICTFDTSSIESNIRKLERQITVNNAKATLELAKANTQVAWAWEDYFYNQSHGEYGLDSAMRSYVEQQNQVSDSIDNLSAKERELDALKDEYDDYKKARRDGTVSEGNYKNSKSEYKDAIASAEEAVSSAGRAVENAQLNLQNTVDNYNKAVEELEHQGVTDLRTISTNMASVVESRLNNMTSNDAAEEEIRDFKTSLDKCNITAPISGLITSVSVVEGEEYDEKSTICEIQDDSSYIVSATVDQYDISEVSESMNCVVKTDATGDDQMEGILTFVSPVPEGSSSSSSSESSSSGSGSSGSSSSTEYPIEISIKGRDERLRIGMTAEASILVESRKGVKAVPYDAVIEDSDGSFYVNKAVSGKEKKEAYVPEAGEAGMGKPEKKNDRHSETGGPDMEESGNSMPGAPGAPGALPIKDSYSGNPLANLIAEKMIGKSAVELYTANEETPTEKVIVEKGLETDYYTEVISDELENGDKVLIPESDDPDTDNNFGMGGHRGPGGPGGMF
ncbi:MAG: efflux RND transporter periplasmic adaptor subunit [Lachnospiraceae bacterium]|nr:efflux RND transporter periplasmic adaptor subunit [Lachnospiraceae bacterium]